MPLYEYKCPKCQNEFTELLSLENYSPLRVCPGCNTPSPRLVSAAHLQSLKKHERIARERNEKSIYEPMRVRVQHQCNHSDCNHDHKEKKKGAYQQISKASRPWMLG
jgi:putative FmdB family regulatory protein